jgi:glucokinase
MVQKLIIGIDLGGTNLKVGLLDLKYKILQRNIVSTKGSSTKEQLISAIVDSVETIIRQAHLKKTSILGLGIGLPGPIDIKKDWCISFPIFRVGVMSA